MEKISRLWETREILTARNKREHAATRRVMIDSSFPQRIEVQRHFMPTIDTSEQIRTR